MAVETAQDTLEGPDQQGGPRQTLAQHFAGEACENASAFRRCTD
jgi:hypothetical protein